MSKSSGKPLLFAVPGSLYFHQAVTDNIDSPIPANEHSSKGRLAGNNSFIAAFGPGCQVESLANAVGGTLPRSVFSLAHLGFELRSASGRWGWDLWAIQLGLSVREPWGLYVNTMIH